MRIALAQLNSVPGDFAGTVRHMLDYAARAERLGADLIVFPATLLCGVYPMGLGESQAFVLDELDAVEDYAARAPLASVVPAYVSDDTTSYVELFLCEGGVAGPLRLRESLRPGGEGGRRPEALMGRVRVAGAIVQLVAGDAVVSVDDGGPDALVLLSAAPFCDADSSTLLVAGLGDSVLPDLVGACSCPVAMLQGVGGYDDAVLAGGSFAASSEGVILAACPTFEEALVTFDVESSGNGADLGEDGLGGGLRAVAGAGGTMNAPADALGARGGSGAGPAPSGAARPRLTTEPVLVGGPEGARPAAGDVLGTPDASAAAPMCPAPAEAQATDPDARPAGAPSVSGLVGMDVVDVAPVAATARTGLLWRALVLATRDYVRKCGFADVIVGLSGGIDSAVVATLAADALGAQHVLGVLMPGPYSSASSVEDAEALARALGIATRTVPIDGLYELARGLYADALGGPFEGLASENLQARLRGMTLMSLANARGALVLNTGNKSESGMGYSTLYGDTVGAYAPIGDVYKGRVYELARWRNGQGPSPVIPENVLVKPPSAELSENQTDEASFGVSYPDIDRILTMHVERGMDAAAIVAAGTDAGAVQRVLDACRTAEFKRRQEPMAPIVSLRSLAERAWPLVLGWRDRADRPAPRDSADVPAEEAEAMQSPGDEGAALAQMLEGRGRVGRRLAAMLANLVHRDQIMGMLGDVIYGAVVSGVGSDMDEALGLPLFSKN